MSATPTSGSAVDLGTPVLSDTETLHHGMVRLDWQDVEDAGWYVVQHYHLEGGEWLDLPAEGVDIAFHGSSAVVSNLHGLSWLRVGAASCDGASEWSQIEELYGTKESDWEGVPVPEVEEGDQTEPCPVVLGTPVLSDTEYLHHGMVQLDWQDIEDAGWYVVQYYHLEGGEWLDLPAEGVDIAFHGSSAVVSNLHGLSWLRVGAASCDGASEWSQIEQLFGTNASDWKGVPVPEVAEGDEIKPCDEDADTSDNSPATGAPTISGTVQVGETLTANTSGVIDQDGLTSVQYEYQWLADDSDIAGATNATYTLVAEDEGKAIKVQVGFTDDEGNEESLTSAATAAVAARPNSPATGLPTITGTTQVGETLTANTSGVADADGLSNVQYEYQWLADDTDISGATNATYTLTAEDEGKAIKVQVGFTDDAGNDESLTSEPTAVVAAALPPPPDNVRAVAKKSGAVELTWDSPQDSTVIGYRIERRPTGGSPSDQQRSAGSPRDHHTLVEDTGSTDTGYTDNTAQKGVGYEYRVSARNEAGAGEESDWVNAEEVTAPNSPATGAPTITGTAQVGETLTANTSGIADADGLGSVQYEYQWLADDTDIAGATGSTYTLTDSEESKAITVQVTFADDADNEETLTSVATTAVAGAVDSGAPSYITVEVTEDYSDPINIVTNFAITWNDADVCSVDYNAYLNIKPSTLTGDEAEESQLHLGSAASDGAQMTAGLTGVQGGFRGFDVELYCGTDGSGRLVSRVVIPGEYTRPKPGTYSSEPPLSALSVSHGTMTPTFKGGTSYYTVPDVANAETRITITATPKEGYFVEFLEGSDSLVLSFLVTSGSISGLSADCGRSHTDYYGPLVELTDADPDTPGFQVDLYDDESYLWVHVYPTAVCSLGKGYRLTLTRAEGSVSSPRPNRPAVGLPVIARPGRDPGPQGSYPNIASPCVGCTMNAFVSSIRDRDGWDESTFSYHWLADDAEITGATSSSYTAADTDLGKTLKVRVSYTDDRGNEETLTSLATRVVRLRNFLPTGKPVILGTPEVGQTLRVDVSGISDPNGMTNATFTYQWVNTPWTDSDEYTLADSDEGRRIWLRAAYTDDAGHMHVLESAATDAVAARPSSPATGAPTISGTAQVGETLTADTSGIADENGLENVAFTYQWLADDADIAGATGLTYTLVAEDGGKAITVQVSFTDDAGNDETLTSAATDAVVSAALPPPPDNVRAVTQKSGAVDLTWEAPGDATVTGYRIDRRRAGGDRSDQQRSAGHPRDRHTLVEDTGSTDTGYTDKGAEKGVEYEYRVSTRNEAGAGAGSDWVRAGPEPAPNNPATGAPAISGAVRVGETLKAETSGIADADGLSGATFSYQWVANDGNSDLDINGATGSTYTLVRFFQGKTIKVRVSFTDDAGNEETLTSTATTDVAGAVDSGAPSYITVEVTEDMSDPINIITNFAITWSDAAVCSIGYNAYLNIKPTTRTGDETEGSQLHLGSAASYSAQMTAGLTGVQGGFRGFDVELYCGTEGSGRLVSRVDIPGESTRPKPGTYSSEPPLSALGVSHGTMTPTFSGGTSYYTVPDVPNAETRITITATPKEGYFVKFFEGSGSPVVGLIVDAWGLGPRPSGLSEDCSRAFGDYYGPLIEMTDADPDTPGLQVDLYDDESYVWVHVYPTAICSLGKSYALTITRAEGEISLPRPNRPAIGLPVIAPPGRDPGWQGSHLYIASPCVGCTMNAFVSSIKDRDGWDESTFSYQWLADDADITGATSSSYTAADTDLGKTLKVRVSFTDDRGNEETLTSLATEVVRLRNFMPTGKPVILGTPEVGQTLRVDVSGISDPNGMTNATFTYQWVNTPWTDDEYTLADSDEGRRIWVQAAYTDDAGHMHMLESAPTDAVAARPSSPATGAPTISGTAQVGETLTADTSGVTDADGLSNVQYEYQWLADDADITGATNATYTLAAEDEGKAIKVQVSFTDDAGNEETLTSVATDAVMTAPQSTTPGEPQNLELTPVAVGTNGVGIKVFWDAPSATGGSDISGYRIQWKGGNQDYPDDQETRQAFVEAAPYTIDTTSPTPIEGDELTVRVAAVNGAGAGVWTEKVGWLPSHTDLELWLLMKEYADEKQTTFPWVLETWNYLDRYEVPVEVGPTPGLGSVPLLPCVSSYTDGDDGLKECHVEKFKILQIEDPKPRIIIHEMAHAYSLANRVTDAPGPLAIAHLYFDSLNLQGGLRGCEPRELYADVLTMLTLDIDESSYWKTCNRGNAQREAQALDVLRSAVDGEMPQWFADTYTDAEGEPDLERLWTDVQDLPSREWNVAVYQLRDAFGGYCNNRLTWMSMQYSEDKLTQPWMDGGCPPPEPSSLEVTPGDGELTLAWDAPASDGDSDVEGYIVQWKSVYKSYDDWATRRQRAVLDSPTSLTYTISGLGNGAYDVRVRAYNHIGPGQPLDGESVTLSEPAIPNTPATGVPTISGTAQVGETLTVDTSGIADEDGMENELFTFFWRAYDATGLDLVPRIDNQGTYTIEPRDVGMTIYVLVILQDDRGNFEVWESAPTDAVAAAPAANSPAIGVPTISGTAQVGETLEADTSGVTDADGLSNVQYEYQWLADDSDIAGATGSTYTLVAEDEGKAITVQVSFTDDEGNEETLTSTATDAVSAAPAANSPATGVPTISGTAQVGETLTANTTGVADADGLSNVQYEYQWLADDADIAGATGLTYTLTDSEESKVIKVRVSFTDDADNEESLTSAATGAVDARPNSPATGAPTITGTAQVGETLTADTSGIADADGLANATFSYQWLADDTDIADATGLTYTLTDSEESKAIKVHVSFTDDADNEESLTSAATDVVAGAQPTEPPAKPKNLSATASHDSVTLTWDDPGDDSITGYVILRRIPGVDPEGHFDVLVADTKTAATSYTDNTVSAETRYTYRIKAINGAGTSERSRWSHIDTPAAPVPDQPTGLEAAESDGQVVLTWDDPGDDTITGYVILRRVRENDTGGDFSVLVADTGSAATTYTDDTVAAGTTYTYRIKAINEHGTSERSRWYHIDIPAAP